MELSPKWLLDQSVSSSNFVAAYFINYQPPQNCMLHVASGFRLINVFLFFLFVHFHFYYALCGLKDKQQKLNRHLK